MSKLSDKVFSLLKEAFPFAKIEEEYFVKYKGQNLFVDFYIPSYLIAVEVHGAQHDVFVEHFHSDAAGWKSHKKRDRLKEEWAHINNIVYVVIRKEDLPEDAGGLLDMIRRCSDGVD